MTNTYQLFVPLSDHVTGDNDHFSISSGEYYEMMERLNTVQNIVTAAEATLRQIASLANCSKTQQRKVNQILHLAVDHVGLAKLARLMLEDINTSLYNNNERKLKADLDQLLGDLTGDEQAEKQDFLNATIKKEEN